MNFFNRSLGIVPSTPIMIGITVILMFHNFFQFSGKVQVFGQFLLFFTFSQWSTDKAKFTRWRVLFLLINHLSGLHAYPFVFTWFGWVLWHISRCRLFNAKSTLFIYIKYIAFGLVGFYGISTIVGYLMPNPLYSYILNI